MIETMTMIKMVVIHPVALALQQAKLRLERLQEEQASRNLLQPQELTNKRRIVVLKI
jgi:hypothetical protein